MNTILDAFPKLSPSGEFKLLRAGTGGGKELVVIGPPSGMTVPYLSEGCGCPGKTFR